MPREEILHPGRKTDQPFLPFFPIITALLAFVFVCPAALAQHEDKLRPASYENAVNNTCILKEEVKAGAMPAFHVYLVLEYQDGSQWSTQEAIIPIDYHLAGNLRERWKEKVSAKRKAMTVCDDWDLEVAVEREKADKEKAGNIQKATFKPDHLPKSKN